MSFLVQLCYIYFGEICVKAVFSIFYFQKIPLPIVLAFGVFLLVQELLLCKKMSRKIKITKPKIEIDLAKVEALAANGLTQQQIADSLGISRSILFEHKKTSDEFEQAIQRGKAKGIAVVTNKLMEQYKNGNTTAIIFVL